MVVNCLLSIIFVNSLQGMAMNNNLSTRSIVLILLVFGAILGGWFRASLQAQDFEGAGHMHLDPQGRLYIQVDGRLFQYEADGRFGRAFDLADIGVETPAGDFAFFSNGNILLSLQPYTPSFLERIRILKRQRNTSGEYRQDRRESLVRCDLSAKRCSPYGERVLNLNQAFHLYIDPLHDEVYLAEGARHQVRKFDADGREIARLDRGLKFPNQVFVYEGRLYIANTNRHEVLVVDAANEGFGVLFLLVTGGMTVLFLVHRINTYKIGVLEDMLILMKGRRRGQILYSDSHILIGNITMPMGSSVKSFFSKKLLIEHLYPLLRGGTELNRAQLQMLLIRCKDDAMLATLFLMFVLIAFVTVFRL